MKSDGVSVGAHELFTPSELLGRGRAVNIHQWNSQAKAVWGASRWTAVELGGHLPHKGRQLV